MPRYRQPAKSVPMSKHQAMTILNEAHAAGSAAALECVPTPMLVMEHENVLDDSSPVVNHEIVDAGPCGFAWVDIRPSRGGIATVARKENIAKYSQYYRSAQVWVGTQLPGDLRNTQGVAYKEAYARAFAAVLRDHGIDASASSRLD